ncbi:MAG: hypothetical protein Q9205_002189 [Flavoplaca limonia]
MNEGPNASPSSSSDTTLATPKISLARSHSDGKEESSALSASTSGCGNSIALISKPPKASKKSRDTPFTLYDDALAAIHTSAPRLPAPTTRTKSQPRLATSLDGSVRVTTGNSPTQSPPRPQNSLLNHQPRPSGPLQRSQSAIVPPTFPITRPTATIGRSRDSRTWEFYCDSNARDELTKQAEREQSGSAVGAIGLIRSCSKGSFSTGSRPTNPHKRNATISTPDSGKRLKADTSTKASKPKLARASSSIARLQNAPTLQRASNPNKASRPVSEDSNDDKSLKQKPTETELLDGNESDKENWAPGTQTSVTPRRAHINNTSRTKILTENQHLPSLSSSLSALLSRESSGNGRHPRRDAKLGTRASAVDLEGGGKENKADGSDDEVRGFMSGSNGSGENVIVGEDGDEEDLDCVEGLLKLSRGDWR